MAVVPGKCCPECLPKSCTVAGKIYEVISEFIVVKLLPDSYLLNVLSLFNGETRVMETIWLLTASFKQVLAFIF